MHSLSLASSWPHTPDLGDLRYFSLKIRHQILLSQKMVVLSLTNNVLPVESLYDDIQMNFLVSLLVALSKMTL